VDVHKDNLAVGVFGWCRDRRAVLVDYWRFEGDTEQLDDPGTWGRLRTLIESQEYVADDGKRYRIILTLIDSGYRADVVYRFAHDYYAGVAPVKGRELPPRSGTVKPFSDYETPQGTRAYTVTVDLYKDRWSAALRRSWDGLSIQPAGHFNAPQDATDKQLRELTAETKREKVEAKTGKRIGWEWHRPSGAANELWDLLIYANAAIDLIAWDVCRNELGMEFVNWPAFYDLCIEQKPYFNDCIHAIAGVHRGAHRAHSGAHRCLRGRHRGAPRGGAEL
jgi:phage terminase large subunit GpA-like protein